MTLGRLSCGILLLLGGTWLLPPPAGGQESAAAHWMLVLDLTSTGSQEVSSRNRAISLPYEAELFETLSTACHGPGTARRGLAAARARAGESESRWPSVQGHGLALFTFFDAGERPTLGIDEKERSSRIASDLATLLDIARALPGAEEAVPLVECSQSSYVLTKHRATLDVEAEIAGEDDRTGIAVSTRLTTGPKEHLFLSTDVVLNKVSQLELDEESRTLRLEEKPSEILVGFNYMLGDLHRSVHPRWVDGLILKVFVEASSRPRDSIGAALGYRFRSRRIGGLQLNAFSPFVGVIRTENDRLDPETLEATGSESDLELAAGLSLNLDTALEWLKRGGS
jgi:hypothetical protein